MFILVDNFDGDTTNITSHTPDTPGEIGSVWFSLVNVSFVRADLVGGSMVASAPGVVSVSYNKSGGFTAVRQGVDSVSVTFPFVLNSPVLDAEFSIQVNLGAGFVNVNMWQKTMGTWQMDMTGGGTHDFTLSATGSYTMVVNVADGAQSVDFEGVTLSDTFAIDNAAQWFMGLDMMFPSTVSVPYIQTDAVLTVYHATVDITAPAGFVTGSVYPGTDGSAITMPMPALSARTGINSALTAPKPTLAVTGTFYGSAVAALTAPTPQLSATGTVSGQASASLTFGDLMGTTYKLAAFGGAVISVSAKAPTLSSGGTTGGLATAAITVPLFQLVASATANPHGGAALIAPAPQLGATIQTYVMAPAPLLVAIGSATVTATYEAYAVNLNHRVRRGVDEVVDETTHYTNFPFDKIVRYKNSYYGVSSAGLFLLDGPTDYDAVTPTAVSWTVKSAETDFGSVQQKTVDVVYFGGRMAAESTINLYAGEGAVDPYSYTTPRGELAQNYRQPFGLGIKARYFAFGFAGAGTLVIDSVSFNVTGLARRI